MRWTMASIALVLFFSGCVCCNFDIGGTTTTTISSSYCTSPYIQVGGSCCLDQNGNGICDTDEGTQTTQVTQTTHADIPTTTLTATCNLDSDCAPCGGGCIPYSQSLVADCEMPTVVCRCVNGQCLAYPTTTTTASSLTTTTLSNQPTCFDGIQNQGETYADCGGPCTDECVVTTLSGGWQTFFGYKFRLKNSQINEGGESKYTINIRTPDGREDERLVTTGESFIDHLRFKIINYGQQNPKVYLRINRADLEKVYAISPDAVLITVGGDTCQQGILFGNAIESKLCTRTVGHYNITGSRAENGVELLVTKDTGAYTHQTVKDKGTMVFSDIMIGVIADREHFIVGGYTLIYVYPKQNA